MKYSCAFLLSVLFVLPDHLLATTIIPFKHLGEAAQASEAVVLATVDHRFESASGHLVFFDCNLRVQGVAKGDLKMGETFVVRQHSHQEGEYALNISGDFVPQEGKTYLLFLRRVGDVWRPITLAYYVFETKTIKDEAFLVPLEESAGFALATRGDGVKPEAPGVYRIDALLQAIRQFAGGTEQVWDGSAAQTGLSPDDFPQERVLPTGCDFALGANLARWQNSNVEFYFDDTDAPPGFSGTLDAILGNMGSNYTGITPINGGETSFAPNCTDLTVLGADFQTFLNGLNGLQTTLLIFEDPCSEVPNLSGCSGTLAVGGSYSSSSTHSYKGDTWRNALYGFVIVNNGTLACLDPDEYEIMLTHELTHTYQMDHLNASNYPDQNMNPFCCNDINAKDIECMNYTYELVLPVELTAFTVQSLEERAVRVAWSTASEKNNHHFVVERSADGIRFETVKTLDGNNSLTTSRYEWIDRLPLGGLSYYRLSQVDYDGQSTAFGIKAVSMGEGDALFRVYPNPAGSEAITLLIDLPAAFNGSLEIIDLNGRVLTNSALSLERGRNKIEQPANHLVPGVYWLRLQEADSVQVLKFYKN